MEVVSSCLARYVRQVCYLKAREILPHNSSSNQWSGSWSFVTPRYTPELTVLFVCLFVCLFLREKTSEF